jgi:predicted aspartyl protease
VSAHSFPFQADMPAVTLTLLPPDLTLTNPPTQCAAFWVDTGFSDALQVDWDTFTALNLHNETIGTLTSELANGSMVTDLIAEVRVVIPECGIDKIMRCISSPGYGADLRLAGGHFLKECNAVIDYPQEQTMLSS